jgi:hypothetical protein
MVSAQVTTGKGSSKRDGMSALGQKRTYAPQKVMSALPPKATLNAFFRIREGPAGHCRQLICSMSPSSKPRLALGRKSNSS